LVVVELVVAVDHQVVMKLVLVVVELVLVFSLLVN
tara:strand:+ start:12 stop:116 length:105 start_codon:yes stop_codon:yes gene_type:complete